MMETGILYVHRYHQYVDRGARPHQYIGLFPDNSYELPFEVARQIHVNHPSKVCLIAGGQLEAEGHKCAITKEIATERAQAKRLATLEARKETDEEDIENKQLTPDYTRMSPQRRRLLKQAQRRSRIARMETKDYS